MGTLFPANLLTHQAVASWREQLASRGDVRLLARIGDFGLFSQALVHVACLVLAKGGERGREFTALVTGNEAGVTGDALRELRKTGGSPPPRAVGDRQWNLFAQETAVLGRKFPWRILTPEQRGIIDALEAAQTPTVGSLFDIAQGVQTGNLKAFLFTDDQFRQLNLGANEKAYFRNALMTDSIENGRIVKTYHLFFPHGPDGPLFEDEDKLAEAVPKYYRTVLKPNESALRGRASIVRANRKDWWGLMHPRTGTSALSDSPRTVSKFFGAEGSFVLDEAGKFLPSTGHVWTPKRAMEVLNAASSEDDDDLGETATVEVLRAYCALLNSEIFTRLVSLRSVTIAGGQFDLSSRFLAPVHLPDLWEKASSPLYGAHVRALSICTRAVEGGEPVHGSEVEQIVAQLYGIPQLAEG